MNAAPRAILTASLMMLLWVLPARAQLQVGENTSMNLNGNIAFGYNGDFSNTSGSDHSISPAGNADLSGFYFNPNFLSFDVQPFFDQSRTNSTSQSVFQSSGVNASASIFSGSNFPGSISFSKVFDSSGQFNVPGQSNFTTRGNNQDLAIGWGVHVPDLPSISLQFSDGHSDNSIFGTSDNDSVHTEAFGIHASQTVAGFNLNGGYEYNKTHAVTPEFLVGEGPVTSDSMGSSFDAGVGHTLPMHGAGSVTFSRSDVSASDTTGESYSGNIDTLGAGAGFQPVHDLDVGVNTQYTNNLTGMLYQSFITAGTVLPASVLNYSSGSWDINSHANYLLPKLHLTFGVNADHRQETILGAALSADTLNEIVTYGNDLFGGFINATAGITQTFVHVATGSSSQGQFDSVSYQRHVRGWMLNGSLNYSRNIETVLIGYTLSGRGYTAGIGRKLNPYSYWGFNAVGTKSDYSNLPGAANSSQGYSSSLTLRWVSVSGSYGKSNGTSILTPTGLTPVTTPTPIVSPLQAVMFGGNSYSIGASVTPRRGFILSASYSDARSNTAALAATSGNSLNTTRLLNGMLQYKVRQLWITGGYLRLQQGFSITGQPPMSDTSFFMGVTRWFKFF